ncbi:MAG: kelch repeat-containing protein, partial [Candidatus Obscuribacter sp.]|nr:kelch repeat-containing protein [Candidatus Obscuribacter sp.]
MKIQNLQVLTIASCLALTFLSQAGCRTFTKSEKLDVRAEVVPSTDWGVDHFENVIYKYKRVGKLNDYKRPPLESMVDKTPENASGFAALKLKGGDWLVSGGIIIKTENEVITGRLSKSNYYFEESSKQFKSAPSLSFGRLNHSLFQLSDGRVLVYGGYGSANVDTPETHIEILDLKKKSSTVLPSRSQGASDATLTEISPGKVIAIGGKKAPGEDNNTDSSIIELIDTKSGLCKKLGRLNRARMLPSVFRLENGDLLVVDGLVSDSH